MRKQLVEVGALCAAVLAAGGEAASSYFWLQLVVSLCPLMLMRQRELLRWVLVPCCHAGCWWVKQPAAVTDGS